MPSSSVGRPAPRPMPVIPAGGADSVSGTISRPTRPAVSASAHRHATRATTSGGSACRVGHGGAAQRVHAPELDAPLVDRQSGLRDALGEDRRGRGRLLAGVGPRERDARLARPPGVVAEQQLVRVGGRGAAHAGHAHPVVAEVVEGRAREVGDDIGREVPRRVVHLVEELVPDGVEAHASAGGARLGDDRGAVGVDLGDRVGEVPRARDRPPVAAQVPARASDPSTRAGGPTSTPAASRSQSSHAHPCSCTSGARNSAASAHATGDHHIGALRERVDDRARTEVRRREHRGRRQLRERRAGVEVLRARSVARARRAAPVRSSPRTVAIRMPEIPSSRAVCRRGARRRGRG